MVDSDLSFLISWNVAFLGINRKLPKSGMHEVFIDKLKSGKFNMPHN